MADIGAVGYDTVSMDNNLFERVEQALIDVGRIADALAVLAEKAKEDLVEKQYRLYDQWQHSHCDDDLSPRVCHRMLEEFEARHPWLKEKER